MERKTQDAAPMKLGRFLSLAKQGAVARELIPMGISAGWPILSVRGRQLCVTIPYFRAELKPDDQTLLYPFAHALTLLWPNGRVVGYSSLRYDKAFADIDFDKPVGTFRHEAIRHLGKAEYVALRDELYGCYDALIEAIYGNRPYEGQERMRDLFGQLMEPGLEPFYRMLGKSFFSTYAGTAADE